MKLKNVVTLTAISLVTLFSINTSLAASTAKVTASTVNLRKEADASSTSLDQLSKDQEVEIIEKDGDWYKVKAKGITGYLRQDLIELNEEITTNETSSNDEQTENTITDTTNTENEEIKDKEDETNNEATNTENNEATNTENNEESETTKNGNIKKVTEDIKLKIVPLINAVDTENLKKDDKVTVLEEINGWVHVETVTTSGWIREEKLESAEPESNPESTPEQKPEEETPAEEETPTDEENTTTEEIPQADEFIKTMYVNTELANIRKEASVAGEVVMRVTQNTEIAVYGETDEWYKVKVQGNEGYISKVLLSDSKKETTSRSGDSVVRE